MDEQPPQYILPQSPKGMTDDSTTKQLRLRSYGFSNESLFVRQLTSILKDELARIKSENEMLHLPDPTIQIQKLKNVTAKVQRGMIGLNRRLDTRDNAEDVSFKAHLSSLSSALREIGDIELSAHNLFINQKTEKLKAAEGRIKSLEARLKESQGMRKLEEENASHWEAEAKDQMRGRQMYADLWHSKNHELENHLKEISRAEAHYLDQIKQV
jgi:hypothetical protein